MRGDQRPSLRLDSTRLTRIVWIAAALAATALALPAVTWQALNLDENITLTLAPGSVASIVDNVWSARGGGPAHFLVEHVTLAWPGGLWGLRLPSLIFFLLALPAAGLVARELFGRREELIVVAALALAPTAIKYATDGQPPTLLLAVFLWSLWASLRAARLGGRGRWALAGLALGFLVFVQPVAPLYAGLALATGVLHAHGGARRVAREAWPAVLLLALAITPFVVHSVDVLRARYDLEGDIGAPRTRVGDTVIHAAFESLAPGIVGFALLALAGVGLVTLLAERPRTGLALAAIVAAPIAFFDSVPEVVRSVFFFDRYMLPALPVFLLLAAVGCDRVARVGGRGLLPLAAVAGVLLVAELIPDVASLRRMHELELPRVTSAVSAEPATVLFGSTGTTAQAGARGALTRWQPPELVDTYVDLSRGSELEVVDESTCAGVKGFLAERAARPRRGVWLFYESAPPLAEAAAGRLAAVPGVTADVIGGHYVLVRSVLASDPRDLVRLGLHVRRAWRRHAPEDGSGVRMLAADREGLDSGWNCLLPEGLLAQALSLRVR